MNHLIFNKIKNENKHLFKSYYPEKKNIFKALEICPINKTKVVILGQDPYHGKDQAHGLAFSVQKSQPIPPSLKNIFKELQLDMGISIPANGDLQRWARQGVLLLNSILTVSPESPGSHKNIGWEEYTDSIIEKLNDQKENLVFMLWGAYAQKKDKLLNSKEHLILKAPHPSPLSAYRGFIGCKHFSKCNQYLKEKNIDVIKW